MLEQIKGEVTKIGQHTKAHYVQCGDVEVLVHGAPQMVIGDNVIVTTNKVLQLAKNTKACWAISVEPNN